MDVSLSRAVGTVSSSRVDDIEAEVERLTRAGVQFRNEIISGVGGLQVLVEDPSGNPIELNQPAENRP